MTKYFLAIAIVIAFTEANASIQAFNTAGLELGIFSKVKCSTGVTCTASAGKLNIVSSPTLVAPLTLESGEILSNAVDDTVQILSDDNHTTFLVKGYEAKDAILGLYADEGDDTADKFSFKYSAAGALTFEVNGSAIATMTGSTGGLAMTGPLSGDGGDALSGFLQSQVASTSVAITAAQCGKTFVSNSADVMVLPEASTVLGCRLTFVSGTADDFDINPADATDVIGPISVATAIAPSAGDAIRITDIGSAVVLEAVGADLWAVISSNGAVTDVN